MGATQTIPRTGQPVPPVAVSQAVPMSSGAASPGPGNGAAAGAIAAQPHTVRDAAGTTDEEQLAFSPAVTRLPVELDVAVPVRDFRVRNLLALEPGQVVESKWSHGEDVPLAAGAVALAWSEFEVVDNQLAVRITRLP